MTRTGVLLLLTLATAVLCEEQSLYESLMSIDNTDTKTRRVSFAGGQKGVQKDDLILTQEQDDWLFGGNEPWLLQNHTTGDTTGEREKRAGTETRISYWPSGVVPYVINPAHFNDDEKLQIREAMDVYEDITCLQFTQRQRTDKQWLDIHHTNDGCYSLLGNAQASMRGPQPISLQDPGCRNFGTYLHELGHAIGLVHEHQLPTRDQHIRYYGTNVDPDNANQLEKYNPRIINTFNTGYDLGSIMHYDVTSFAVDDSSITLGVDNPWLAQHIGRRYSNMLSFGDAKTVNTLYQCGATCDQNLVRTCITNRGYVNRKCECINAALYYQRYCTDEPGFEMFCARIAPQGQCDIRNIEHHKNCRKTCGFCPRFLPGDVAIGQQVDVIGKSCVDRYHNPLMCQKWSALCANSLWMHRYCRKTCNACASKHGMCPNLEPDSICDRYKKNGLCGMDVRNKDDQNFKEYLKVRCADSCGTCGYRNMDLTCRNVYEDFECKNLAANQMCEKNPLQMFTQCPSTCNRCYWNKGTCKNNSPDADCIQMALANLCTHGGPKRDKMRQSCPKTCNACNVVRG